MPGKQKARSNDYFERAWDVKVPAFFRMASEISDFLKTPCGFPDCSPFFSELFEHQYLKPSAIRDWGVFNADDEHQRAIYVNAADCWDQVSRQPKVLATDLAPILALLELQGSGTIESCSQMLQLLGQVHAAPRDEISRLATSNSGNVRFLTIANIGFWNIRLPSEFLHAELLRATQDKQAKIRMKAYERLCDLDAVELLPDLEAKKNQEKNQKVLEEIGRCIDILRNGFYVSEDVRCTVRLDGGYASIDLPRANLSLGEIAGHILGNKDLELSPEIQQRIEAVRK